jgi:hypothetical protein
MKIYRLKTLWRQPSYSENINAKMGQGGMVAIWSEELSCHWTAKMAQLKPC